MRCIIEEVGPENKLLSSEDLSGNALVRKSKDYISILKRCDMNFIGEYSLFNKLFLVNMDLGLRLGLDKYEKFNNLILKNIIKLDLFLDDKFKNTKSKKGFHLLFFKKLK